MNTKINKLRSVVILSLSTVIFDLGILTAQNVGITDGTTFDPNYLLHLKHNAASGTVFQITNTTSGSATTDGFLLKMEAGFKTSFINQENAGMAFYTYNTERITILSGGNVGIGTTSPGTALDVQGGGVINSLTGYRVNNAATTGNYLRGNGTNFVSSTIQASDLPSSFSGLANPTASLGLTAINGTATTAMRSDGAPALSQAIVPTWTGTHTFSNAATYSALFTGGNVGIGLTNPSAKLHVYKEDAATNTVTNVLNLSHYTTGTAATGLGTGIAMYTEGAYGGPTGQIQASWYDCAAGTSQLRFLTNQMGDAIEKLRISVGDPAISGGLYGTDLLIRSENTDWVSTDVCMIRSQMSNYTPTTEASYMAFFTRTSGAALAERMRITPDGNVGIGSTTAGKKLTVNGEICYVGSCTTCSDKRYKKNVVTIDNALNKILNINGVYYYWKRNQFPEKEFSDGRQIGIIAQELEKYFPEVVSTDNEGFKSIDYSRLSPILIEAIKEQQRIIEKQQNKIDMLEKDNKIFKDEIKEIKAMLITTAKR